MPDQTVSGPDSVSQIVQQSKDPAPNASTKARPKRRRRRTKTPVYAALDLGTNNCRLLVARPHNDRFRVIDSYSKVVRLGKGLAHTGQLSEQSMDDAIEALRVSARKMAERNVTKWRCVATQAMRQATNGDAFLKRVKEETGVMLEVISPRVEARLSVMGCLNLIDTEKDVVLVVDIGGGSTEISWVDVRKLRAQGGVQRVHRPPISAWASLPVGVVTLSEKFPEQEDREMWFEEMKDAVRGHIIERGASTRFTKAFAEGRGHIIGTSGTITSLAGIHLNLPYYQRDRVDGLWMPQKTAVEIARDMAFKAPKERAAVPSIGKDRSQMLVAGCAIIDVLCELWPCEQLRVADRGLREGILMGLMGQSQKVQLKTSQSSGQDKAVGDVGDE
ncbi:MAG: Ppx/GppA phosphatase family protein [Maricaulaceae bacterium]